MIPFLFLKKIKFYKLGYYDSKVEEDKKKKKSKMSIISFPCSRWWLIHLIYILGQTQESRNNHFP